MLLCVKKKKFLPAYIWFLQMSICSLLGLRFIVSRYCCLRRSGSHDSLKKEKKMESMGSEELCGTPCGISAARYHLQHLTCMTLMDPSDTSQALNQEIQLFARQQVSTKTIRRLLQKRGPSAKRSLTLYQRSAFSVERRTWHDIVFSIELWLYLRHHDDRVRVWWHHGERPLPACIRYHHTCPSWRASMEWWFGVLFDTSLRSLLVCIHSILNSSRYTFRSVLVLIDGISNSGLYISVVLRPVILPFILALRSVSER